MDHQINNKAVDGSVLFGPLKIAARMRENIRPRGAVHTKPRKFERPPREAGVLLLNLPIIQHPGTKQHSFKAMSTEPHPWLPNPSKSYMDPVSKYLSQILCLAASSMKEDSNA